MQVKLGYTCAVWTMIHPSLVPQFFHWLESSDHSDDGEPQGSYLDTYLRKGFNLSGAQVDSLRAHLVAEGVSELGSKLLTVSHKAGELVKVPAGWLHQVVTILPCMRITWQSVSSMQSFPRLAAIRKLAATYTAPRNNTDWIAVQSAAFNFAVSHP